jgi:hypothetical protein
VPGFTRLPSTRSLAATNLASGGFVLVYRIPRSSYDAGPLELVVHDPLHHGGVAYLPI